MQTKRRYAYFALCVDPSGHEGSLSPGKIYRVIKPESVDRAYDLRVVDEEGEDYLHPAERFVAVDLPARARRALAGNGKE